MKRAILTPAVPTASALADLNDWLGITTAQDNAELSELLAASLETCEAFTGVVPISVPCEEVLPVCKGWQRLSAQPVQAITQVETLDISGARGLLAPTAYALELDADGAGGSGSRHRAGTGASS